MGRGRAGEEVHGDEFEQRDRVDEAPDANRNSGQRKGFYAKKSH